MTNEEINILTKVCNDMEWIKINVISINDHLKTLNDHVADNAKNNASTKAWLGALKWIVGILLVATFSIMGWLIAI